jgi:hypothetical protein
MTYDKEEEYEPIQEAYPRGRNARRFRINAGNFHLRLVYYE